MLSIDLKHSVSITIHRRRPTVCFRNYEWTYSCYSRSPAAKCVIPPCMHSFLFSLNFASSLRQLEVSKILPTSVHPRGTCSPATELSRSTKKELFEQPWCLLQMQTEGNKLNSLVNYCCCCFFSNVAFENSSLVRNQIRFNYSDGERS